MIQSQPKATYQWVEACHIIYVSYYCLPLIFATKPQIHLLIGYPLVFIEKHCLKIIEMLISLIGNDTWNAICLLPVTVYACTWPKKSTQLTFIHIVVINPSILIACSLRWQLFVFTLNCKQSFGGPKNLKFEIWFN